MLGLVLIVLHLSLVAWFTLRPRPVQWVYDANLQILASIRRNVEEGPWAATKAVLGGLGVLAPLGVLLPMLAARAESRVIGSFLRTVVTTAVVAVGLGALQSNVPGRMFNVDDVLLSTVGAAVVHLAVVPAVRRGVRRRSAVGVVTEMKPALRQDAAVSAAFGLSRSRDSV